MKTSALNEILSMAREMNDQDMNALVEEAQAELTKLLEAAKPTLAGGQLELVRVFDESDVEEVAAGEYQVKSAAANSERQRQSNSRRCK